MNVYVETNFVLELVFEQEESASCEQLLLLCESDRIQLLLPTFSLAEPHDRLIRQAKSRAELGSRLRDELRQLVRNPRHSSRIASIQGIVNLVVQSTEEERRLFSTLRDRIIMCADIIPTDSGILRSAVTYERTLGLQLPDAIIYASVASHLQRHSSQQSCFLNRNTRDFSSPDIVQQLRAHSCTMIPSFTDGLGFVMSRI